MSSVPSKEKPVPLSLNEQPCFLLLALARALSHQVRTPLSVVVNELSFLQSTSPSDEIAAALARCRQIADLLTTATIPGKPYLDFAVSNVAPLLREAFTGIATVDLQGDAISAQVRADQTKLSHALRTLVLLLRNLCPEPAGARGPAIVVVSDDSSVTLHFELPAPSPLPTLLDRREISSTAELFYARLDWDRIEPALIDAVFMAHRAELSLTFTDWLVASVTIPLHRR